MLEIGKSTAGEGEEGRSEMRMVWSLRVSEYTRPCWYSPIDMATVERNSVRNKSNFGSIYLIKYGNKGILNQPERARYRGKKKLENAGRIKETRAAAKEKHITSP